MRGHVNIDGVDKCIKSVYIGVNGKAKSIMQLESGIYKNKDLVDFFKSGISDFATVSIGEYGLVCCGYQNNTDDNVSKYNFRNRIMAYDSSLIKTFAPEMPDYVLYPGAAKIGDYAIVAGGRKLADNSSTYSSAARAYNETLTQSSVSSLSATRQTMATASNKKYALFAGGETEVYNSSDDDYDYAPLSNIDIYDNKLTKGIAYLPSATKYPVGGSIGDYAIIAGGDIGTGYANYATAVVNAYNSSMTRISAPSLSARRTNFSNATIENYTLFIGGTDDSDYADTVFFDIAEAYDSSLTKTQAFKLSTPIYNCQSEVIDGYLLVGGGYTCYKLQAYNFNVEVYDSTLTKVKSPIPLTYEKNNFYIFSTHAGKYALFTGGYAIEAYYAIK